MLRLLVRDQGDTDHWRWVLTDIDGDFLVDHVVALDRSAPFYPALFDLPGYLRTYAAHDRRAEDQRRIVMELGAWITTHVLGERVVEQMLRRARPSCVVRVAVPPTCEHILAMPLESASLDGTPVSLRGVSLVFESESAQQPEPAKLGERLRMLALLSPPPAQSPLNLRREGQALRTLVRHLATSRGLAIDLRVVRYGVTRETLRKILRAGGGWDVVHLSGHASPGALVLANPNGKSDLASASEVTKLLRETSRRLKLVTLSASESAAATIDQTLIWLGLDPVTGYRGYAERQFAMDSTADRAPTFARAIVRDPGCAILALRYAVNHEFAAAMAERLYENLFATRHALPRAIQLALESAVGTGHPVGLAGSPSAPVPALFGARAATLLLAPPKSENPVEPAAQAPDIADVPDEPAHFAGRNTEMAMACTAIAEQSLRTGVVVHGMAGVGKTTFALELLHQYHAADERFQGYVWYSAPQRGGNFNDALSEVAIAIERVVGVGLVRALGHRSSLQEALRKLTRALRSASVLIVLDNVESLLSPAGAWRDERWAALMAALLAPGVVSRTVLTTRIRPAVLPMTVEIIELLTLSRDEELLLIMELPHLRRLLDGAQPGIGNDIGRKLVGRTLNFAQGHPKLIELAECAAADPQTLIKLLDHANKSAALGGVRGAVQDSIVFVAESLPAEACLFFHFLCATDEGDRTGPTIQATWTAVLKQLGHKEPAPDPGPLLIQLAMAGLIELRGREDSTATVAIHSVVAETGRSKASARLLAAIAEIKP